MNDAIAPLEATLCDREPIHIPGSIQPHGMMLVADYDGLVVRHVAGDIECRLGVTSWHGQDLKMLIGEEMSGQVARLIETEALGGFAGQFVTPGGETLDVSVHLSEPYVVVELESASAEGLSASRLLDRLATAAAAFERTNALDSLCERAAIEFRRLTGFDRVMIYRFLSDDAGKVLAEDRREDLHSFLNHHFPASDIPAQARALYVRNVLRVIPDIAYEPIPLRPAWTRALPLDMTDASLRSVSPIHLQYLANMGVRASASFSIVKNGGLWGLVACHNETPRRLSHDVRAACRSLVGSLEREIKAKREAEGLRQRLRLRSFEDDIIALLSMDSALDEALSAHLDEVRRIMDSGGVAVLRGRDLVTYGLCPEEHEIRELATWLLDRPRHPIFSTSHLASVYAPGAAFARVASGLLTITLLAEEPWLVLWFRAEQIDTVRWAGDPRTIGGVDGQKALTPRASFDAWTETVRGRARPWPVPAIEAATRLRAALLEVKQNRNMRELNVQLTKILQDKDRLVQQKDFLIGEVNHRVQNSLAIVASFLGMQSRASTNPELHDALEEARRRLTAVAIVHRRLYHSDRIETVDAARYIEELCADTFAYMGPDWAQHLRLNLAPVSVSTDRAVTLGLVITELLINANKHAYGGTAGLIEIDLIEAGAHFHIIVSDKGGGRVSAGKGGFGSRIVDGLVKQLGGELSQSDNRPGLRVKVTVPFQATT